MLPLVGGWASWSRDFLNNLSRRTVRCVHGIVLLLMMHENNYYARSLVSEQLAAAAEDCNITLCLSSVRSASIKKCWLCIKLLSYWTTVCWCCLCNDRTACIIRSIDCRDVALDAAAAAAATFDRSLCSMPLQPLPLSLKQLSGRIN